MAYQTIWYFTGLPKTIVDTIEEDLSINFDSKLEESKVGSGNVAGEINTEVRNSKNAWIPTSHWIGGFLWHYVMRANRENFLYDLTNVDGESLQYTSYGPGQYYGWHNDAGIAQMYKPRSQNNRGHGQDLVDDFVMENCEKVRKLSFSLQLSDPYDYEGGQFQFMDEQGKSYIAPRERGTIILFDSRTPHRVRKVTKGVRKSIVGWVVGPRWK